jgi:hypothetical protein
MRPFKPWIDWRKERERLEPLLARQGGIVSVLSSNKGPIEEFASVFRSSLEHRAWPRPWRTIQIDPTNSRTRYFDEMVRQIERSLGLPPDSSTHVELGNGSKLGSDLNATSITIENSFNLGGDEYALEVAREKRCSRLVKHLIELCRTEPICFLFVGAEDFLPRDLRYFRELIWDAGLSRLQTSGVLLATFSRGTLERSIGWPEHDVAVQLADHYDDVSRQHAVEDLANQLISDRKYTAPENATAYSTGIVDSHSGPATLYATLAAIATRVKQ